MPEKTDLRVVKTRAVIRNALVDIMSEKELSRITISEICALAKINRKTFYRHYRAVEDVITELENEILDDFAKSFHSSSLSSEAVIRSISEVISRRREFFLRTMKKNPDIFSSGRLKAMLCRMIAAALRNTKAVRGEEPIKAASEFVVAGVLSLYTSWFEGGCAGSLELITDISVKMVKSSFAALADKSDK